MLQNGSSLTGFEHAQAARIYIDMVNSGREEAATALFNEYLVAANLVPSGSTIDLWVETQTITSDLDDHWLIVGFSYSVAGGVASEYVSASILALRPVYTDNAADPPRLVELETDVVRRMEGHALGNALVHQVMLDGLRADNRRVFSMRDGRGQSILCMSAKDGVVRHVVGYRNRPPTPAELDQLQSLLVERQITLIYTPGTTR